MEIGDLTGSGLRCSDAGGLESTGEMEIGAPQPLVVSHRFSCFVFRQRFCARTARGASGAILICAPLYGLRTSPPGRSANTERAARAVYAELDERDSAIRKGSTSCGGSSAKVVHSLAYGSKPVCEWSICVSRRHSISPSKMMSRDSWTYLRVRSIAPSYGTCLP